MSTKQVVIFGLIVFGIGLPIPGLVGLVLCVIGGGIVGFALA
jgi:hypothetical protein